MRSRQTPSDFFSFFFESRNKLLCAHLLMYRVILKKVSFGVFRAILVSKEEKDFTTKNKDKGLSLSKFS